MGAEQSHETKRVDHLGAVAGVCNEIGLIEQINRAAEPSEWKVSCGAAVQAMVLNALPTMHWIFQGFEGIDLVVVRRVGQVVGSRCSTSSLSI